MEEREREEEEELRKRAVITRGFIKFVDLFTRNIRGTGITIIAGRLGIFFSPLFFAVAKDEINI